MPRPTSARLTGLTRYVDVRADRVAPPEQPTASATSVVREAFTGDVLGEVPIGTVDDVDAAFGVARPAQAEWAERPVRERAAVLRRFGDLVHERRGELLDIIQAESGKNRLSALDEVMDAMLTARFYAEKAPVWLADAKIPGVIPVLSKATVVHRPRGVVGMISPWNYPFSLPMGDGLAALVAGNAIVHKPASLTPYSTLVGLELWEEAGLPRDLWQVVPGSGREVGGAIVDRCDFLMFTGSSATGAELGGRIGARLKPFSAELGGKNPMIVGAGVDLDRIAEIAVRACFASAGQLCMSIERIYVERAVFDEFCTVFARRVSDIRLGGGYGWTSEMGSLASDEQMRVVTGHIADAVAKGARIIAGGRRRPDIGPLFHEPTLLVDVPAHALCHDEETFGPVVAIYPVDDLDEAVDRANDSDYGLASAVFCETAAQGYEIAARLHTGMANVDEGYAAAWSSLHGPSGGMGASGVGYRHGKEGLLKYTQARTIATQSRRLHFGGPDMLSGRVWGPALEHGTNLLKYVRR